MSRPALWEINQSLKHSNELICYKNYEIIEMFLPLFTPEGF